MKIILLLTFLLVVSTNSATSATSESSQNKFICSTYYIYKYEDSIRKLKNDKQMHCSMSCLLARKCGKLEASAVGLIKEIVDVFTDGTPDRRDLAANRKGIIYSKKAYSDQACINYCIQSFPAL